MSGASVATAAYTGASYGPGAILSPTDSMRFLSERSDVSRLPGEQKMSPHSSLGRETGPVTWALSVGVGSAAASVPDPQPRVNRDSDGARGSPRTGSARTSRAARHDDEGQLLPCQVSDTLRALAQVGGPGESTP